MFHHQVYPKMTIQSFSTHPYAELGLNWNRFNMLNNWKNDSNMQLVRHNPSLRKLQDPKIDLKKHSLHLLLSLVMKLMFLLAESDSWALLSDHPISILKDGPGRS